MLRNIGPRHNLLSTVGFVQTSQRSFRTSSALEDQYFTVRLSHTELVRVVSNFNLLQNSADWIAILNSSVYWTILSVEFPVGNSLQNQTNMIKFVPRLCIQK